MPDMAQRGEAGPHLDFDSGEERLENGPHRVSAKQQGFRRAAAIQEPIGENMPALWISTELDFINGNEAHLAITRHCFNCAGEPACLAGNDFLLPRQEVQYARPLLRHELFIIFAREQAQRKTDHPVRMGHEALQREPGFTSICGSEEGGQARSWGA